MRRRRADSLIYFGKSDVTSNLTVVANYTGLPVVQEVIKGDKKVYFIELLVGSTAHMHQ